MKAGKEQWEEEAIERFISLVNREFSSAFAITGRDVRPNPSSPKDFDYQLQNSAGLKLAVEIFRLVEDGKELARDRVWADVVRMLKDELLRRNIRGYVITTKNFIVKKTSLPSFTSDLADKIESAIRANSGSGDFEEGGLEYRKIEKFDSVGFARSGEARYINPMGTAASSFAEKLPTKNLQVAAEDHLRILLVLNWAGFVDAGDAIHALTKVDLGAYPNVDQIYFEERPGTVHLVFDRAVSDAIIKCGDHRPSLLPLLLETLRYRLGDKDPQACSFIRAYSVEISHVQWLVDKGVRENLVHFADELLKNGKIDDVLWIVRHLQNDPDPLPDGANSPDDPEGKFNYHRRVLAGEETSIITTVRGHLCWLLMRLVDLNRPEFYGEILEIVRRYISEPNLYIRIHVTYPLAAFVRRRRAIKNEDGTAFVWDPKERAEVAELAFQMLRENAGYPRVLAAVQHVFQYFRDLSEEQATEMASILLATKDASIYRDLAPLIIYFALFRQHQYSDLEPFNPDVFLNLLDEQIRHGLPEMRSSLAWHFWKALSDRAVSITDVRRYLYLFWEGPYERRVASNFGLIFEVLAAASPEDAVILFEGMLERLTQALRTGQGKPLDYWVSGFESVAPLLGCFPEHLIRVSTLLKEAWIAGCIFVGLPTLFESYASVPNCSRARVKAHLQAIYSEMKEVQPKLPTVDWSK